MFKKCISLFIFISFSIASLYAEEGKAFEEFSKQLKSIGLEFNMPADFKPVKVVENEDVHYYFAIKHKKKDVEVRYSIFPYTEAVKTEDRVQIGSDSFHKEFTTSVVLNIAGDEKNIETFKYINDDMVKKNFNADVGYIAMVKPESGFGKGYKKALIVGLYKSRFGFSYHTILYNESGGDDSVLPEFFSVRFRDKK